MQNRIDRSFRDRLRVALATAGWTQRQLAARLCVADTTLSGWLTGAHEGPDDLVQEIERKLGLPAGALAEPQVPGRPSAA